MKLNILIYPDKNLRFLIKDLIPKLNTQFQFEFKLLDEIKLLENIIIKEEIDFNKEKENLSSYKSTNNIHENDLLILFTFNKLSDSEYNASKLFLTGRNISEEFNSNAIASLHNINWSIFASEYNYEIQKHSLLHLLICALISNYCEINPHQQTEGCLLDQNIRLVDFKEKISKGYFLCSKYSCQERIQENKYGHSILQLCHTFKYNTLSADYVNIPINDIRSEIIRAKIDSELFFKNLLIRVYEYAVKKPIEEWGFYNFLWAENKPVKEKQAQIAINALYKIILEIRAINIGKETETGGGFVDFLISYNDSNNLFKVGVEIKNAHHPEIENSKLQLIEYLKSETSTHGILIILWYKNDSFNNPNKFETADELKLAIDSIETEGFDISTLIINCTKKTSPSKIK